LSDIRGRVSVYGPGGKEPWLLFISRGFCILLEIDKQWQSVPSDAPTPAEIA